MRSTQLALVGALIGLAFSTGCRSHAPSSYSRMFATSPKLETLADYKLKSQQDQVNATSDNSIAANGTSDTRGLLASINVLDQTKDSDKTNHKSKSGIQLASFNSNSQDEIESTIQPVYEDWQYDESISQTIGQPEMLGLSNCESHPIDLATAFQLAGASNWSIQIARESVREARARYAAANMMWLPTLQFGIGYNGHEGRIQDTEGNVIDVSRHSVFAGGGAKIGGSPVAGGSGGPLRFAVDLSLADTIFEPLARCQLVKAQQAEAESVFNDTMMETGIAYYELVRGEATVAMAQQNLADAVQLAATFESFVEAGKGAEADNVRAKVIESNRQQLVLAAQGERSMAGARLSRLLQLDPAMIDPNCGLTVVDASPLPIDLVSESDLQTLISLALGARPEIARTNAELCYANHRLTAECWRPAVPLVYVGGSGGGFGGGPGSQFPDFKGRADLDVAVAWEMKNLGLGNRAMQRERNSQRRQAEYQLASVRDQIISEVSAAYFDVRSKRDQITLAQQTISDAQRSLNSNVERIRALEGSPLELIQAIESLASARENYLNTVIDYNQAQLRLLNSIGSAM